MNIVSAREAGNSRPEEILFQQAEEAAVVIRPHADIRRLLQSFSRAREWWHLESFPGGRKEDPFRSLGTCLRIFHGSDRHGFHSYVIGKALDNLDSGTGIIKMLVMLR